jgi:hypothetical protein
MRIQDGGGALNAPDLPSALLRPSKSRSKGTALGCPRLETYWDYVTVEKLNRFRLKRIHESSRIEKM